MTDRHLVDTRDVVPGLCAAELVPPPGPGPLGTGSTATLRAAMARFRSGVDHEGPRRQVESAIDRVDVAEVATMASQLTAAALHRRSIELVADVGFVVPTQSLALALGVAEGELESVGSDVRDIVTVIGRQHRATDVTDAAVDRLLTRFSNHPDGPVAVASMLYQNHDATAALFAAAVSAGVDNSERRSALARTVRIASAAISIGGCSIEPGDTVELSLDDRDTEFGAGPHQCPGRELTSGIVDAMTAAVIASGRSVDGKHIERSPDGRAAALPLVSL